MGVDLKWSGEQIRWPNGTATTIELLTCVPNHVYDITSVQRALSKEQVKKQARKDEHFCLSLLEIDSILPPSVPRVLLHCVPSHHLIMGVIIEVSSHVGRQVTRLFLLVSPRRNMMDIALGL